ncbi:MAG: hypothetical protein HXX08_17165 [Chloroflexi bacterium]|uniref:YtkA-like domain-containing protein n=1 Tax=Candidatus Chlorohelix allophototropha TaxID=3003348 RepID=A0A8T7M654_9CHLR|nr:hypothetical protein [Chloroflexota bacterium]WJW69500.1 hypothetical protein OZ401_003117 [Chloroflexota bacterium L227-S17]
MENKLLKIASSFILTICLFIFGANTVFANGGTIIFAQDVGPFNVIVSRSPTPPTIGASVHLSILITKASNPQKVTDATVIVNPAMPGMDMPGVTPVRAYRGQTENTYDVDIPVNMEGQWTYNIQVISPQLGESNFPVKDKVEKADAPWIIIIAILVGLPIMAGVTWFLLFRKTSSDDEDEEKTISEPTPESKKR